MSTLDLHKNGTINSQVFEEEGPGNPIPQYGTSLMIDSGKGEIVVYPLMIPPGFSGKFQTDSLGLTK